jgi:tetratricopeptide (TPR) repeat protein
MMNLLPSSLRFAGTLLLVLGVAAGLAARADASSAPRVSEAMPVARPAPEAQQGSTAGPVDSVPLDVSAAAYEFALAKMLMDDGDYRGARSAFERALELDPDAAYVRIEFAEFLSRLGRFGRTADERETRLREAVEQAALAERALPGNVDALRAKATANLALAAEIPEEKEVMATAVEALEGVRALDPYDVRSLLSLGQIYLRRGEAGKAADVFETAVDTTPGYEPAYRLLAEALLESGRRREAVGPLRKVLEGNPDNESVRLALAEALAARGEHGEAAEVLRQAPGALESVEARTRLATELYLTGELEAASETLGALILDAPDSRYVRLLHGLVLSALARNDEALATLEPLLDGGPGDADLAVTVSDLLLRQEREDEAVDVLRGTVERLEAEGPIEDAAAVRVALARLYANLGRWETVEETVAPLLDEVASEAEGAEGREPPPEALLLWADALAEQGRGADALERLTDLDVANDRVAAALLSKKVELLARVDRLGEAIDVLDSLVSTELADGDRPALLQAAEGLHRAGHFEETIAPLERFVASRQESVAGRFLLGAARERAGRREAAEEIFRALIDDEPDFHPALNYLGYMWIEEGRRLEEGLDLVRRAVRLDPDNGAYVDSLGWGYYQLGRYEQARDTLERAARLTQDPTIYEHLGDVYVAIGKAESARKAYRRAIDLEADDPEAVARKLSELGREGEPTSPGSERH